MAGDQDQKDPELHPAKPLFLSVPIHLAQAWETQGPEKQGYA